MKNTKNLNNYPLVFLNKLTAQAIKQCYKTDWETTVVRQSKTRPAGNIDHVDYAMACFELSKQVAETPQKTAWRISSQINKNVKNNTVITEPVNGFVNFELSEKYIERSIDQFRLWLKKPKLSSGTKEGLTNLLVFEPMIYRQKKHNTTLMAKQIYELVFNKLGLPLKTTVLFSDYSEVAVDFVFQSKSSDVKKVARKIMYLKPFEVSKNTEFNRFFKKLYKKYEKSYISASTTIYKESDISGKVNTFLNKLNTNNIVQKNNDTSIYLLESDQGIALRSVNNYLFRMAFLLYVIDRSTQNKPNNTKKIVVFAPQQLHPSIYSFIEMKYKKGIQKKIMCFDPIVSRANISDLVGSASSFSTQVPKILRMLHMYQQNSQDRISRNDIITLLDFPVELVEYATKSQLPALFDVLHNTLEFIENQKV